MLFKLKPQILKYQRLWLLRTLRQENLLSCVPWHISDLLGSVYVCSSRSKIQCENWQSQKRLEYLLKGPLNLM